MTLIGSTSRPGTGAAEAPAQAGGTSTAGSAESSRGGAAPPLPPESRMNRVAKRAHELYEARGGQDGTAVEDWLTAEREIDEDIDRIRATGD